MRRHAAWLMLRSVVIIAILLSVTLGGGISVMPNGGLYLGSDVVLAAGESWLGTWENRIQISVDCSKIDSMVTNFPMMIHLSDTCGVNNYDMTPIFDELGANSLKLALTTSDGETQCYVEIELWDNVSEEAILWFKAPMVNTGEQTLFYLYYDSAQNDNSTYVGVPASAAAQNVWNSGFAGVWHLGETSDGTSGEFKDSTSNANHGTGHGDYSNYTTKIASACGYGQYFDGEDVSPVNGHNQYIEIPDDNAYSITTTDELMYEIWLDMTEVNFYSSNWGDPENDADYIHALGKCQNGQEEWLTMVKGANSMTATYQVRSYIMNLEGGLGASADLGYEWEVGDKIHVYGWFDNNTTTVYHECWYPDGTHDCYNSCLGNDWSDEDIDPENGSAPICLGGHADAAFKQYFRGIMDEFRIMSSNQDAAWRKANHFAQADELLYFGESGSFSKRYEYYRDDNDSGNFGGTIWIGQSFTPSVSHTLKEVRWKIRGDDSSAGNINCYVYTADENHKPTGPILSSGSIPCSDVLGLQSAQVYTIQMTDVVLTAGEEYCMVLSAPNISNGHFDYRMDTSGEYGGGMWLYSSTSGSSWSTNSFRDMYFEEWGISDTEPTTYVCDLNGDGRVNVLDMIRIGQHQGESGSPGWIAEDVNKDGTVNVLDMVLIGQNWTG